MRLLATIPTLDNNIRSGDRPAPKAGLFSGYVGRELIVRSRQPFLDGARALLAPRYDQSTPYNMRHCNWLRD
jgi:hypothetical protein